MLLGIKDRAERANLIDVLAEPRTAHEPLPAMACVPGIVIGVPSVPGLVAAPRVDSRDEPRTPSSRATHAGEAAVDLYWLPLGAGGYSVRLNGRAFEAIASRVERRPACDLYHSALEVRVDAERFVIEQAPVRDGRGEQRGVVAEGPVGSRWAGRLRIFRYRDPPVARRLYPRHRGGRRRTAASSRRSSARTASPRPDRAGTHARVGSR